ncbi:hypothetical protein LEN26_004052 [Aphanomyces euteiches]|nr:hypothetical protein LEN26_004052 [Aphanomyces euteiches]
MFFKAADIGKIFALNHFIKVIRRRQSSYILDEHYKTFTIDESPQVFLTFGSLMHALHVSVSNPVIKECRTWINRRIFEILYGNGLLKKKLVSELCKIDKAFLQAFMQLVPNEIACVYLVDTSMVDGQKKIYKFGRSMDMEGRFYNHGAEFDPNTAILDSIILVPIDQLAHAEMELEKMIKNDWRYDWKNKTELSSLNEQEHQNVRDMFRVLSDKYNGSLSIQINEHESQMNEIKWKHELQIQGLQHENEMLRCSSGNLENTIESLKWQLEAREQIQEARIQTHEAQKQTLEFQLGEKDRLIREMQERPTTNPP